LFCFPISTIFLGWEQFRMLTWKTNCENKQSLGQVCREIMHLSSGRKCLLGSNPGLDLAILSELLMLFMSSSTPMLGSQRTIVQVSLFLHIWIQHLSVYSFNSTQSHILFHYYIVTEESTNRLILNKYQPPDQMLQQETWLPATFGTVQCQ
jgi:hypothetical protein